MKTTQLIKRQINLWLWLTVTALAGCHQSKGTKVQGYIEGEFVYISSPQAGAVKHLFVARGAEVKSGDLLFALESAPEDSLVNSADQRLAEAKATFEDLRKGERPSEIEALRAQLGQVQASLKFSEAEFSRQERLARSQAVAVVELDRARTLRDQDRQRQSEVESQLTTAQLGAREDKMRAASSNISALEAELTKAQWTLAQKQQKAPHSGLIFDTLYREGEWVAAGRPVISLLPPQNIKVRAFAPEKEVGKIHLGDSIQVGVDGVTNKSVAKVTFISPQVEYTPPVIYSRDTRQKLVFMIEATFEPDVAITFHPGQPVDVEIGG